MRTNNVKIVVAAAALIIPALAGAQTATPTATSALSDKPIPNPPRNLLVPDGGKLLLTAGFSDAEGAGGGGLVPWALITGYGSNLSYGVNGHITDVRLKDFDLRTYGIGIGIADRFEISAARQKLDVTGTALKGVRVEQDIFGVKVKLAGDAVYGQDTWLPQLALGAEFKRHGGIENAGPLVNPRQLGATDDDGVDVYLSGTKVFLDKSLLVNVTLRHTKANQLGLLGYGGDQDDSASLNFETTVGYVLTRKIAIGGEYRSKPDSLGADDEGAAWDLFVAWAPNRHVSVLAAYLNMGNILGPATTVNHDQDGTYLSVQFGF
ncbi:MAG TPA: DUF3034 family protein [Steroidobacteraceae bacterium]|nr:DUF3034 family protein [Steroidobacteraceae bacterium]